MSVGAKIVPNISDAEPLGLRRLIVAAEQLLVATKYQLNELPSDYL